MDTVSEDAYGSCADGEAGSVRLIAQGLSNREACRLVGINRRTGTRWRLGRTIGNTAGEAVHYPPMRILTPPKRHPRYLSLDKRMVIADLQRENRPVREIARELGGPPATVSRELRRGVDDRGRYLPRIADRAATERLARPRARRVLVDAELRAVVVDLLFRRPGCAQLLHGRSRGAAARGSWWWTACRTQSPTRGPRPRSLVMTSRTCSTPRDRPGCPRAWRSPMGVSRPTWCRWRPPTGWSRRRGDRSAGCRCFMQRPSYGWRRPRRRSDFQGGFISFVFATGQLVDALNALRLRVARSRSTLL